MTTQARKRRLIKGIDEELNIASWNVRGICNKEAELEKELMRGNVDIALISETKKKLQGSKELDNYILFYSGVPQEKRAAAGTAILILKKYRNRIHSYTIINERLLSIRIKIARGYLTVISVYAPEEGRKEESIQFYKDLQKHLDTVNKNDQLILGGDLNARIGQSPVKDIIGNNGEQTLNENGKSLRNFAVFNHLKVTNSFFRHRDIHRYTWTSRGQKSIIDYILVNKRLSSQVLDTRVYRSYDVSSDHFMLMTKIKILKRWLKLGTKKENGSKKQTFKVYLLKEDSIRRLYCQRLDKYLDQRGISLNVNTEWEDLKQIIIQAATEALGKRNKKLTKRGLSIWNEKIASLIKDKKEAYLKYLNSNSESDLTEYRKRSALAKRETRKLHRQSWDRYISNLEYDVHGAQTSAYKIMRHLNKSEKDTVELNNIAEDDWLKYFKELWTYPIDIKPQQKSNEYNEVDNITMEELNDILNTFKANKTPGSDEMNIELIKYASPQLKMRFLDVLNICWSTLQIPSEWKIAIIRPIFKKGKRDECKNYRGISLLNTSYKIFAKIITRRLNIISEVLLNNEQHGFRRGRACTDCIFIVKQIIQKRREFNQETHLLFIDYIKAFDKVLREKLWDILLHKGYPQHLVEMIRQMYEGTVISIDKGNLKNILNVKKEIVNLGVRQGCPLSPTLFNIYLDAAIAEWQAQLKYDFKVGSTILNTILFADDQVVFADKEDKLQLALFQLNKTMSKYNLTVSHEKTKVMAFIGKYQIRSKIILNNMILEQVRHFNYLGCDISFDEERDLKQKVHKFQSICGTIKRTLKNKTRRDTVLKFYKTMAVPVLAYGAETWAMNRSDKRIIETAEMRFLRYVAGCTLRDHIRSEDIRAHLNIFCLNKRIEENQVQWKEHISRMPDERLVKQVLQYRPTGVRDIGRPRRRWEDNF